MTKLRTGLLCILCLTLSACATHTSLNEEFDRSVKAYNRMLRWHEIENAGATYIDQEQQAEYQKQAETLKKRGLSITDFRILSSRYLPEKKTGDVNAEFDYFMLPSNRIKTISYRQEWIYRDTIKSWKQKNALPVFE